MKNREAHPNDEDRIDQEAAEWVVKQDDGLSAAEQDAFFQWLADDPRHGERYAIHGQSMQDANLLAEWRPEHSIEPNPDLLASRWRNRSWIKWGGGLMALAACIAVILNLAVNDFDLRQDDPQVLRIAADSSRFQSLDDGSQLDLNKGSIVEVRYTSEKRFVRLIAGEAYFKVAKNPNRPFVVEVNGTEVSALGTAFNIRYQSDAVEVVVTEGRVRWARTLDEAQPAAPVDQLSYREMVSGQKSVISSKEEISDHLVIQKIDNQEIESMLDWRHRTLDFDSTPLDEAILEFNRRNTIKIEIEDPSLNKELIVGSVRSDNIESFVLLLKIAVGCDINRDDPGKIVLKKSAD